MTRATLRRGGHLGARSQLADGNVSGSADFDIYIKGRDRALIVFRGGKNDGRKALTVGERCGSSSRGGEPRPDHGESAADGGRLFGDVARMRFAEDFTGAVRPGTEKIGERVCRVLDLTAISPKAPYPRVTLWLDAEGERLPRKLLFFLPSGKEAREVLFTKFQKVKDKTAVAEMEIHDLLGPSRAR